MRLPQFFRAVLAFVPLIVLVLVAVPARAQDAPTKVDIPKWETLKAAYDYDKNPQGKPLSVAERLDEENKFNGVPLTLTHLAFTNGQGHKVTGLFLRPKADPIPGKAYPVVVLLHGMGSDKETMMVFFGRYLASRGIACLALDAPRHGERREPGQNRELTDPILFGLLHEQVLDYRLALDWLEGRKDVDRTRIGVLGVSMGAMMGAVLGAVDGRIQAAAVCLGGEGVLSDLDALAASDRPLALTTCPTLYIGHFAPRPVLLVNAKADRVITRESAERLQEAAKKPKEVRWIAGGHALTYEEGKGAMDWLIEKLTAASVPSV